MADDSTYIYKEVYFDKYCKKCIHKDKPETEDPCDECLAIGHRPNSHKPEKFFKK